MGHFVICADSSGKLLHHLGEQENLGADNEEVWPVFYPEAICLGDLGRIWVGEVGRNKITLLDENLSLLHRFDAAELAMENLNPSSPVLVNLGYHM